MMEFLATVLDCDKFEAALLFASYEARSVEIGRLLSQRGFKGDVYVFYCDDLLSDAIKENVSELVGLFGERCRILPVSYRDPTQVIIQSRNFDDIQSVFIDTSAFTRENLFTFLWARRFGVDRFPSVVFGYTAPESYGSWLSSGYGRAHNMLGFGGTPVSTAERNLICCVGYESERALAVIESLEPSHVTLAFGSTPTRDEFLVRNKNAVTEVLGRSDFDVRDINVKDPKACLTDLRAIKNEAGDEVSVHVAPFNTKVCCLSIFALWLEDRSLRVWNAFPETYNVHDYSHGAGEPQFFDVVW